MVENYFLFIQQIYLTFDIILYSIRLYIFVFRKIKWLTRSIILFQEIILPTFPYATSTCFDS